MVLTNICLRQKTYLDINSIKLENQQQYGFRSEILLFLGKLDLLSDEDIDKFDKKEELQVEINVEGEIIGPNLENFVIYIGNKDKVMFLHNRLNSDLYNKIKSEYLMVIS